MIVAPFAMHYASRGMVCSVDHLASAAGVSLLRDGGSAVDAAVATNAVLAVTSQHQCGLGGDLFALVLAPGAAKPAALVAVGVAGSGADPERLRREGRTAMPRRGDIRAVTVPGCVDGWLALHNRYGRAPLADVLAPAIELADGGFPAPPTLATAAVDLAGVDGADDYAVPGGIAPGTRIRRPGVARALTAITRDGRTGFYGGDFGRALVELGAGEFTTYDLERPLATWADALAVEVWERRVWTAPPPSQGYLALAGAWLAGRLPLPREPADGRWARLLADALRAAGSDRDEVLHEHADARALLAPERLERQLAAVGSRVAGAGARAGGDTAYLCAVDGQGIAVSLIQSNFEGWGSLLVAPRTGIFLQNRGAAFSLTPSHPAEYRPGRRPPHTLSPLLVTRADGSLDAVLGTMGGDAQPQILVQLLARRYVARHDPAATITAPRWVFAGDGVRVEGHAPAEWADELRRHGYAVEGAEPWAREFGHAHLISAEADGVLAGASDPRALGGAALGL